MKSNNYHEDGVNLPPFRVLMPISTFLKDGQIGVCTGFTNSVRLIMQITRGQLHVTFVCLHVKLDCAK